MEMRCVILYIEGCFKYSYGLYIIFCFWCLQEKVREKIKEKFDKCNKEKLWEFCDVFDIYVFKVIIKKVGYYGFINVVKFFDNLFFYLIK